MFIDKGENSCIIIVDTKSRNSDLWSLSNYKATGAEYILGGMDAFSVIPIGETGTVQ